jgi:hypothetical protein
MQENVFVIVCQFHPSVIFLGKARNLLSKWGHHFGNTISYQCNKICSTGPDRLTSYHLNPKNEILRNIL